MLKKLLALSDQGACKLRHGIVATTIGHLCIMAPISILMRVTMGLLEKCQSEDYTGRKATSSAIVVFWAERSV